MADASASASQRQGNKQVVHIHGTPIPAEWLVQRHDSKKFPDRVIVRKEVQKKEEKEQHWVQNKDKWIAMAAAGVHLFMFAYNLAFWGTEGMPPDRYWPTDTRLKMGIKPGRYGNLEGTKRIWYENLAYLEGIRPQ